MLVLATQSSRNEQKWDKTKTPAVTEANENMQALLNSQLNFRKQNKPSTSHTMKRLPNKNKLMMHQEINRHISDLKQLQKFKNENDTPPLSMGTATTKSPQITQRKNLKTSQTKARNFFSPPVGSQHSKLMEAVSVSSSLNDQSLIQTDVTSRVNRKNQS